MSKIEQNRKFMHCPNFSEPMGESDQAKGIEVPPHSKAITGEVTILPSFENVVTIKSYEELLDIRRSERAYADKPMTMEQLAFLLWSTQGMQEYRGQNKQAVLRPVPSGGCRHPFELYVAVRSVEGLKPGFYRYAPLENVGEKTVAIEFIGTFEEDYTEQMKNLLAGQTWGAHASVVLIFSCVPYRAEWRYNNAAHRVVLIDLGHAGQNAMLSAAALGLGSCCIAAYNQDLFDKTLGF
ncbi:MAG: SagB/ThcOx family dehydrogenase, partial [Defluviitaleaceae bacterium]|nr:SagB/ThcOx family dehydrogenase [Defluviitaleaceae bacterium]